MARKPNYGFDRKERERAKAAKPAERVKAKAGDPILPETEGEPEVQEMGSSTGWGLLKHREDPEAID